jgi:hypothetical protein
MSNIYIRYFDSNELKWEEKKYYVDTRHLLSNCLYTIKCDMNFNIIFSLLMFTLCLRLFLLFSCVCVHTNVEVPTWSRFKKHKKGGVWIEFQ